MLKKEKGENRKREGNSEGNDRERNRSRDREKDESLMSSRDMMIITMERRSLSLYVVLL